MAAFRRICAGLVLVFTVIFSILSKYDERLEQCAQRLAHVGKEPVVQVCEPPGITDLWGPLLFVLFLLWPDLSEFGIAGITLKRRLEEQAKKQEKLESEIGELELTVSDEFTVPVLTPEWESVLRDLNEKLKTFAAAVQVQEAPEPPPADESHVDEITLQGLLLQIWGDLQPFADSRGRRAREIWDLLNSAQKERLQDWRERFQEELRYVRATRNAVAHPPHDLTRRDIENALQIGRRLYSSIVSRLRHPSNHVPGEEMWIPPTA